MVEKKILHRSHFTEAGTVRRFHERGHGVVPADAKRRHELPGGQLFQQGLLDVGVDHGL